eukprot:6104870-Prymnesium_polylepis.1
MGAQCTVAGVARSHLCEERARRSGSVAQQQVVGCAAGDDDSSGLELRGERQEGVPTHAQMRTAYRAQRRRMEARHLAVHAEKISSGVAHIETS